MDHAKSFVATLLPPIIVSFILLSSNCRLIHAAVEVAVSSSSSEAVLSRFLNNVSRRLKEINSRPPAPRFNVPRHYRFRAPPNYKAPPPPTVVPTPAPQPQAPSS
ncbi:hypothetical protein PVK06_041698 [Gossypium arboreum]|uniref:Transmembrane protein n=1 Tax=Gossypium arboreum TaxID=29729 RepID=A0ABR0NB58_GOSAR|nr:hypothetical protein PVK06_041698 [Gossypium arboreum]